MTLAAYAAPVDSAIRVLLVDDAEHIRRLLTTMLTVDGFEVIASEDGEAAIVAAKEHEPDVVVLDYRMPGLDGVETARRLRADRPDQKMIIYTSFVDPDLEREAATIGVALCLGKAEGIGPLEQEIRRLAR